MQRRERDELVAVDHLAVAVDGQDAVAVAVEREAQLVVAGAERRLQALQMRRAAAVVDVASVRLVGEDLDLGAEPAEDLRSGLERRAVGGVEQDTAAGEVERLKAGVQLAQVVLERAVELVDATDLSGSVGRR